MNPAQAKERRRNLAALGGAAAISVALGIVAWLPPAADLPRSETGRPVLPAFASKAGFVTDIAVTTGEESYHIVKQGAGWIMPEKGGYPVTGAKVQELTEALSHMLHGEAMTRDDRKFDRIGLGDPAHGGTAALLVASDGKGNEFAKLYVGYRDGRSYIRRPDDLQAWSVGGVVLPPLQRGAAWLDLDVVKVAAGDIVGSEVRPGEGPSYRVLRAAGGGYEIAPPYNRRPVIAALGPGMVAEALTRFTPTDVAPAIQAATGTPVAEHITRLASGVVVVVRCWRARDRGWVTISAATREGASPAATAEAARINSAAAPWAFALTELDWSAFSTPLNAIVN